MATVNFVFADGQKACAELAIRACADSRPVSEGFLETEGYVCMDAVHFLRKRDVDGMGWQIVPGLGRTGDALKSFPVTRDWNLEKEKPFVEYGFTVRKDGAYELSFYVAPRNPRIFGGSVSASYSLDNGEACRIVEAEEGFFAEPENAEWSHGVTDNIRILTSSARLKAGYHTMRLYAGDPNLIPEKIVIRDKAKEWRETHLAPPESFCVRPV